MITLRRRIAGLCVGTVTALSLGAGTAGAATIQVDSFTDDGTDCTLREAIESADGNVDTGGCLGDGAYGDDTITFAPNVVSFGTISLAEELEIDPQTPGTLEIQGPGADSLGLNGQDSSRVLVVSHTADMAHQVEISGLTLRDGFVDETDPMAEAGAGVLNFGVLTLDQVSVVRNVVDIESTTSGEHLAMGGGIANFSGIDEARLRLIDSTVAQNQVTQTTTSVAGANATALGGGVANRDGFMLVERSTIFANTATASASDPGGTSAEAAGGGVFFGGTGRIGGSTVTGNVVNATATPGDAASFGGGVAMQAFSPTTPPVLIGGSTIAGNTASSGGANLGVGVAGAIAITSTALAQPNLVGNCAAPPGNIFSGGHNLSDDATCSLGETGDMNSTPAQLETVAFNGGPTQTRRPFAPDQFTPSPLIDNGVATGQDTDQRGLSRTVDYDLPNPAGGDGTDIGAVEIQGATPTAVTPASPNDDPNPTVTGTSMDVSTVHLFSDAACATEVDSGTPQDFASPGFMGGPLALGQTANFRATGEYGTATSLCSPSGVSYTRPGPPTPPVNPTPPPVIQPPVQPPATTPKKCKKGQKLKKGKCVKKKRKKKQ